MSEAVIKTEKKNEISTDLFQAQILDKLQNQLLVMYEEFKAKLIEVENRLTNLEVEKNKE